MRAAAVLGALLLLACPKESKPKPAVSKEPVDSTSEAYVPAPLPRATVYLEGKDGVVPVEVEVAATPESRTRGLMWRRDLDEGRGMLFIFPSEEPLSFWMRNTLIPLDMIFFDKELVVVGVVENAEPGSFESRGPGLPSQYVLEVPGGWSRKIGLKAGPKARLEGAEKIVAQ